MLKKSVGTFELAIGAVLSLLLGVSAAAGARAASKASADRASPTTARVEADTYLAEIAAAGPYEAGTPGTVRVSLTAKAEFHINEQYPYRFKTSAPPPGVSYPKPVLQRGDGQYAHKTAAFDLPFVATRAGQFAVGGTLSLSVCSPTSCIVRKVPLKVTVTVQ